MSLALTRESYFWHKVHSLTGIVPVGFYMLQHLTLNSFSLGGAEKFNAVIYFFEGIPLHLLLLLEIVAIWLPLAFHAIYGLFIVGRAQSNYFGSKYGWSQNRMYTLQRWSGIFLFFFLIYHVLTTTVAKYLSGSAEGLLYAAWNERLTSNFGLILIAYMVGVLAASYHLAFGVWNFCIRWVITISEAAQNRVQRFAFVMFIAVTLLGWAALGGFLLNKQGGQSESVQTGATRPIPAGTVQ